MLRKQPSEAISLLLHLPVILVVAGLIATLFTAWVEPSLPFGSVPIDSQQLISTPISQPLAVNTPLYLPEVGLVAGHYGNDSGAVCPDGLREVDINLNIAMLVQKMLAQEGIRAEILQEFDPKLTGYRASLLLSIHADSCAYINNEASGFKVAAALANSRPEKSARLVNCLRSHYAITTGLKHHNSVTMDMTDYHAFNEIHPETVAAIIEVGFMNLDRVLLTQKPELVALGIKNGLLCYLNNESIPTAPSP